MSAPLRGQIYRVDVGSGPKPWVVVSNNMRNRHIHSVLGVRITTTPKTELPTMVRLAPEDPLVGVVLADEIQSLSRDEMTTPLGALSPSTIMKLNQALKIALAVP
jgi:mRNA interferase MazF